LGASPPDTLSGPRDFLIVPGRDLPSQGFQIPKRSRVGRIEAPCVHSVQPVRSWCLHY